MLLQQNIHPQRFIFASSDGSITHSPRVCCYCANPAAVYFDTIHIFGGER
jgi:hypothetical protein